MEKISAITGDSLISAMQVAGERIEKQMSNQIQLLKDQRKKYMEEYEQEQAVARAAAAQGDRSENAELQIANDNMSRLTINIQSLDTTIEAHERLKAVSENSHSSDGRCNIGSLVCIVDKSHDVDCWVIKLYPEGLGNAKIGAISVATALGKALLNQYKGTTVNVKVPGRNIIQYEIKEVL